MSAGLVVPSKLPDGRVEWHEHRDLSDRLTRGDATLGWGGDPEMHLVCNVKAQRWEVWRVCEDGVDRMMLHRDGLGAPGLDLIRALVAGDTRHIDVIGDLVRDNDRMEADRRAAERDRMSESADKLAHALARDLDLAAPAGKVYGLR